MTYYQYAGNIDCSGADQYVPPPTIRSLSKHLQVIHPMAVLVDGCSILQFARIDRAYVPGRAPRANVIPQT